MIPAAGSRAATPASGPYQTTGFKVGEVTDTSAIVWTRLTRVPLPNPFPPQAPVPKQKEGAGRKGKAAPRVPDLPAEQLPESVPGTAGEVRVGHRLAGQGDWQFSAWQAVDAQRDFTRQIPLSGLQPQARYELRVESRGAGGSPAGQCLEGAFRTAPAADQPARVLFAVSTCQSHYTRDCPEGYKIYGQMLKLQPDFFVHTGDIVYYDYPATPQDWALNIDLARRLWWRTYSLPSVVAFHRQTSSYFQKDDHDTLQDDCFPTMTNSKMGQFTFAQGQAVFREQVPMGELTYRTRRWGRDLQIWMVEGRDFRSPNTDPDGPDKSIWGPTQKAWFKQTVRASDATLRVLLSPTPLVGPDRAKKRDNHANTCFAHEGNELRQFIAAQKNMVVLNGDRHWQYHSIDPQTGLHEYSCGSVSDKHAGGWPPNGFVPEYHRYLRVAGGFLTGTVERIDGKPSLTLRFYDVDGQVRFEDRIAGE